MTLFSEKINPKKLHHGYVILGDREYIRKELEKFLTDELQFSISGNPDFSVFDYTTFGINEARLLNEIQQIKGLDGESGRKIFVIGTHIITDEAQNALLKVFEEPTPGTHFFIIASQNTFLPTFLSRISLINLNGSENTEFDAQEILDMPLSERLFFVGKLAGDISDEKKVKQDAIEMVNALEKTLYTKVSKKGRMEALEKCESARSALFSRGAMIKMILENLMLQV